MRIVFDIDETLNNLNTVVNNKYKIVDDLSELFRYELKNCGLSNEKIELFKQGYLDDSCYTEANSYANIGLMNLLLQLNVKGSTIFYTKCLKESHKQVKLDWLKNTYNIGNIDKYSIENFNKKSFKQTNVGTYYLSALNDKVACKDVDIVIDDCLENLVKYSKSTKKVLIAKHWNTLDYKDVGNKISNLVRVDTIDECLEYLIKLLIAENNTYELNINLTSNKNVSIENLKVLANDINRTLEDISQYNIVLLQDDTALCLGNLYLEVEDNKLKAKTNLTYIINNGILSLYKDINTSILKTLELVRLELCSMYVLVDNELYLINDVIVV